MDRETLRHISDHNKVIGLILDSLQAIVRRQDRQGEWLEQISKVLDPGSVEAARSVVDYEQRQERKEKFRIVGKKSTTDGD